MRAVPCSEVSSKNIAPHDGGLASNLVSGCSKRKLENTQEGEQDRWDSESPLRPMTSGVTLLSHGITLRPAPVVVLTRSFAISDDKIPRRCDGYGEQFAWKGLKYGILRQLSSR